MGEKEVLNYSGRIEFQTNRDLHHSVTLFQERDAGAGFNDNAHVLMAYKQSTP